MEEWRDIPNFVGRYQISDLGRVKALSKCWKMGKATICIPECIMVPQTHYRGYMFVHLHTPPYAKRKYFIHRIVADVFIPNPEGKPIVNHKDRDKKNNAQSNLEWVTASENTSHWMRDDESKEKVAVVTGDDIDPNDIPF